MTSIYSVYHGLPPKSSIGICRCSIWASINMSTNNNLLLPQPPPPPPTTTHDAHPRCPLTMPTHDAHPRCPPIVATPPPTTDNHLDTPVHHPNDAGTPRQQPQPMTMMTHHNHNYNRRRPCHNNGRMTTHHPPTAPMATSTQ